jgi:hypothetical protein
MMLIITKKARIPMSLKKSDVDPKEMDAWKKHLDAHRDQMTDEQVSLAEAAQEVFAREIKDGKHRRLEILMSRPEGAEDLRSKVTEEIFHLVAGYIEDPQYIGGSLLAALNEPDIMQHSPIETPGEKLLRVIGHREDEMQREKIQDEMLQKPSVQNYLKWREIEEDERSGHVAGGSASAFLEDLRQHQKPFPKGHEIAAIEATFFSEQQPALARAT